MSIWKQNTLVKKPKGSNTIVENLARVRGIENLEEWLHPTSKNLHDPYSLKNIEELTDIVIESIHKGEKINIVGDIDSDGVNSCAVMYNYLKNFVEDDLISYSHSQRSKGHGVGTVLPDLKTESKPTISKIPEDTDLVIIVDSSSNDLIDTKRLVEQIECKVVIIDHHEMELDNVHATVVNCQDGIYPNTQLSGSAMAWKVCKVIDEKLGTDLADDYLDLASVGLIGDVMSVEPMENRYIINKGLSNIKNIGLKSLFKAMKTDLSNGISVTDISYKISPAISSCTRYEVIENVLELLTTEDKSKADELSKSIVKLNEKRKKEESDIFESILPFVDNSSGIAILISNEIESGFRGLIATKISQHFRKPAFVLKPFESNGKVIEYSGSARSYGKIPLKTLCNKSGLFTFATGR